VAAPSLGENELRFLGALLRRNVRFMLVGLSAAALQGAPVVTQDVDLWFEDLSDPRIREALQERGNFGKDGLRPVCHHAPSSSSIRASSWCTAQTRSANGKGFVK